MQPSQHQIKRHKYYVTILELLNFEAVNLDGECYFYAILCLIL